MVNVSEEVKKKIQTDMLVSAANTGLPINIKKGQFLSGENMERAVEKVRLSGNDNVILTERGNIYGYGDAIVDIRNIIIMKKFAPVIFDATHSSQVPGVDSSTGGQREMIPILAKSAVAAGCDGLFMEVHDNPELAKSDASTQWPLGQLEELLTIIKKIFDSIK